jgi:2-polyprenyl-3-methyl-5-hydroxy-6-metoxy-1,4-benzoquinol methylase
MVGLSALPSDWDAYQCPQVAWAKANISPSSKPSILDIGSGNGTLSIALCEAGYSAEAMLGIDYSPHSVKLAQAVAKHRLGKDDLKFETCDFLNEDPPAFDGMNAGVEQWDLLCVDHALYPYKGSGASPI